MLCVGNDVMFVATGGLPEKFLLGKTFTSVFARNAGAAWVDFHMQ